MAAQTHSELQQDLGSSIAVKITAPVLWIIVLVGVVVAVIFQNDITSDISKSLEKTADFLSFGLERRLKNTSGDLSGEDRLWLRAELNETPFVSITLIIGDKVVVIGRGDRTWPVISRKIITVKKGVAENQIADLELKHPPLKQLIAWQQRDLLIKAGIPFLLFAVILASLIHYSVTRPINELMDATQAVTKGDLSRRIESDRNDEFGHLGEFFNKMLDKLQSQQEQLSEAVEKAESANVAKSLFLANMSHEIRTPLTAIIGFSEVLRDKKLSEVRREQEVESILKSGIHLQGVINDILDFSKIEAGQLVIEKLVVSPISIVQEVADLFFTQAEDKGLKFNVKYEYPLPKEISTDPTRFKQILLNLCSNAIKFTEVGSVSVVVSFHPQENKLRVSVTDTGTGIDEKEQVKIFQPFTQADITTTRKFGGTGLGLCISTELANKLGGGIRCNSKFGVGSQFILEIDAGDDQQRVLINSAEESQNVNKVNIAEKEDLLLSGKVLLAEDNVDNQRLLGFFLTRIGVDFVTAENGAIAVSHAMSDNFDLVLMDMQMPVMDGVSAIRLMRQQGFTKPIVVLTANVLKEDREACENAGANDFLTKPVDRKRFNNLLEKYLA